MSARAFAVDSAEAMEAAGARLAQGTTGLLIFLRGQLAAGKTTLARGYIQSLGHHGAVKSPTFTLVETYHLPNRSVHHFDLYRLASPTELEFVGIDEYFADRAECLIEWPERGVGVLPPADIDIEIAITASGRELLMTGSSEAGIKAISTFFNS